MDPITVGVLSGLIVNALSGMEKPLVRTTRRSSSRLQEQLQKELHGASSKYRLHVLSALPSMELTTFEESQFIGFLNSSEAHVTAHAIAITVTTNEEESESKELQDQAAALIALSSNISIKSASKLAHLYYESIATVCRTVLEILKDKYPQEYIRAREAARIEQLAGYLKSISHRTKIFKHLHANDIVEAQQFIEDYLMLAHARAAEVAPAHLSEQRTVPLERIYIAPTLLRTGHATDASIQLGDFLTTVYRDVVLGDPGAGKSTMAQKIMYDMTSERSRFETIPFIISLRDLQIYQRNDRASIARFIETHMKEEYQLEPPPGIIEYLLASGRALVILDGLDELIDTYKKRQMRKAIENFAQLYAPSPILVTSRRVGYAEAPLSADVFRACTLAPFTDAQSAAYVTKWFDLDNSLSMQQRAHLAATFLAESSSIEDLRSNPLMLSLLCNVYRGQRSIPQSRAELYQECALMLFERWDTQRGIRAPGALRGDARLALQATALWIYESPQTAQPVSHGRLSKRLQNFLRESRYEDERRAQEVAEDLLQLWRGRAWVLTDCGTSPKGEVLYSFTHQTFLEYFAGVELTRHNPNPATLWAVLEQHIAMEEWDIVAQVAIQTLDSFYDRGTDAIYTLLAEKTKHSQLRGHLNLLSFASRYIDALRPGPGACRILTRACIDLALIVQPTFANMPLYGDCILAALDSIGKDEGNPNRFSDDEIEPEEFLHPLLRVIDAAEELGEYCRDEFRQYIRKLVQTEEEEVAAKAFVLGMNKEHILAIHVNGNDSEISESARLGHRARIFSCAEVRRIVARFGRVNFWIPIEGARSGCLDIAATVRTFGIDFLFCSQPSVSHSGWMDQPMPLIVSDLVAGIVGTGQPASLSPSTREVLHEVAVAFRNRITNKGFRSIDHNWFDNSDLVSDILGINPDDEQVRMADAATDEPSSSDADDWQFLVHHLEVENLNDDATLETEYEDFWSDVLSHDERKPRQPKLDGATNIDKVAGKLEGDELFGAICLVAMIAENEHWLGSGNRIDWLAELKLGLLQLTSVIFLTRLSPSHWQDLDVALRQLPLIASDREIVRSWALRRISFVTPLSKTGHFEAYAKVSMYPIWSFPAVLICRNE